MPTHALGRCDLVRAFVHVAVCLVQRLVPEMLPREDLGVLHEQPPEGHERTVGWPLTSANRGAPLHQAGVSLFRTIDIDALLLRSRDAVLAETGDAAASARATMIGAQEAAKRSL